MQPRDSDLLPGEQVVWAGAPARYLVFERHDLVVVPFSVVWGGISLFVYLHARSLSPNSPILSLFGIPFLLVAAYLLVGRFVVRYFALRRTHYVVTDRRFIIYRNLFGRRERTAYLSKLSPPQLRERADGIGTITFGDDGRLMQYIDSGRVNASNPPFQLKEIESARQVRDLIASGQEMRRSLE